MGLLLRCSIRLPTASGCHLLPPQRAALPTIGGRKGLLFLVDHVFGPFTRPVLGSFAFPGRYCTVSCLLLPLKSYQAHVDDDCLLDEAAQPPGSRALAQTVGLVIREKNADGIQIGSPRLWVSFFAQQSVAAATFRTQDVDSFRFGQSLVLWPSPYGQLSALHVSH